MRRQARARPKSALLHVRVDCVGDGPVDGPFSPFQVRQPHCHCRNIRIVGRDNPHVLQAIVPVTVVGR